ncbi:MAG TPA: exodeoxyribonuclease III [Povalibacter sp.]
MQIATWNVNSLRVRLPQLTEWLAKNPVDVIALQETKCPDEGFPFIEIEALGYHAVAHGQKSYNGVAILSKLPVEDVVRDMPGYTDEQRRVLSATIGGVRIVNVYVPNGQAVDSPKYQYKLVWLEALRVFLRDELARHPRLLMLGDFNIAPEDRDVHDPVAWAGQVLCSEPERAALRGLFNAGLTDVYRRFEQPERMFSWWDYRMLGFRRNHGLRIDLLLASSQLSEICDACHIDKEPRRLERPSDHAPVVGAFRI